MIIKAGLTCDAVPPLLNSLSDHFPNGEMILDAVSQLGAKIGRRAFKGTDVPIGRLYRAYAESKMGHRTDKVQLRA